MFESGQQVEVDVCLGEENFGIDITSFKKICKSRVGDVLYITERRNIRIRFKDSGEVWSFPPRVLKII